MPAYATKLQVSVYYYQLPIYPPVSIGYFQCNCDIALPTLNFEKSHQENGALISANNHKPINKIAVKFLLSPSHGVNRMDALFQNGIKVPN
jgi:hypothetical protein